MRIRMILIAIVVALCGCTALGSASKLLTPTSSIIVQAAVDAAVAQTVGTNPATQKANAMKIKAIAQQILALDTATALVPDLEAVLNAKIGQLGLSPGDLAAAMLLTNTLEGMLNLKIATSPAGAVTNTTSVAVAGVANAVITATQFYGA